MARSVTGLGGKVRPVTAHVRVPASGKSWHSVSDGASGEVQWQDICHPSEPTI
jgi:hypothetical protein